MLSLSFKEIMFFKIRFLLVGFIMFFIAALVFIISGLANGLSMDNASAIKKINAESFYLSKDSASRIDRSHIRVNANVLEKTGSKIQPLGIQMGMMKNEDSKQQFDVTYIAVKPGSFLEPEIFEGTTLKNGKTRTVIADSALKKAGVKLGDQLIDERSGALFAVAGFTEKQTFSHTPAVFMSLNTWTELSGEKYNALVLQDKDLHMKSEIASLGLNGTWIDKDAVINGIPGYKAEQNSLFMMLLFLIIIAVLVLAAFFYIMTIHKTNQFGILKAIGAKTSYLIIAVIVQVVMITVISITGAAALTWLIVYVLPADIPFVFELSQIWKYSVVLCAVAVFGSLLSSLNIVKADPIQAMGGVE